MINAQEDQRRQAEARWLKEIEFRLNQSLGAGGGKKGGDGGAADHAYSQNWANFVRSGEAALYGGNSQQAKDAFHRRYYGGAVPLKQGQSVNANQLNDYVRSIGGNPYSKQRYYPGGQQPQSVAQQPAQRQAPQQSIQEKSVLPDNIDPSTGESNELLDRYLEAIETQTAAANEANQERYDEGHSELSSLRDRTMDRVENFGVASKADIEQQYAEAFSNTQASLQARGLGNSTIVDAFRNRNARDKQRELQRLSESVDDRAAKYDQSLSNNLVGFVERRTDEAPDFNASMQIAQQLGLGNNGQGFVGQGGEAAPRSRLQGSGTAQTIAKPGLPAANPTPGRPATTAPIGGQRIIPYAGPQPVMTPWGMAQRANQNPFARVPLQVNPIGEAAYGMLSGVNASARNRGTGQGSTVPRASTARGQAAAEPSLEQIYAWRDEYERPKKNRGHS